VKAVITAAGRGTRLLPTTKQLPKEMLPIFHRLGPDKIETKPLLQLIFEQLFDIGIREFCFIVGREKRAIEDHFTPDEQYLEDLQASCKNPSFNSLKAFYSKLDESTILWANQPSPRGFGDAVLYGEPFVGDDPFIVHAGDTYVPSFRDKYSNLLMTEVIENGADASLLLHKVENPSSYGVAILHSEDQVSKVVRVVEKPERPLSNLAIMPIYAFSPSIFNALKGCQLGVGNEIQLTDGIQRLIEGGSKVCAITMEEREKVFDVGSPESYWIALKNSYVGW